MQHSAALVAQRVVRRVLSVYVIWWAAVGGLWWPSCVWGPVRRVALWHVLPVVCCRGFGSAALVRHGAARCDIVQYSAALVARHVVRMVLSVYVNVLPVVCCRGFGSAALVQHGAAWYGIEQHSAALVAQHVPVRRVALWHVLPVVCCRGFGSAALVQHGAAWCGIVQYSAALVAQHVVRMVLSVYVNVLPVVCCRGFGSAALMRHGAAWCSIVQHSAALVARHVVRRVVVCCRGFGSAALVQHGAAWCSRVRQSAALVARHVVCRVLSVYVIWRATVGGLWWLSCVWSPVRRVALWYVCACACDRAFHGVMGKAGMPSTPPMFLPW